MFSDSGSGSSYYYVGVEDNGRLLAYSDGYAMIAPFGDRVIQMDVDYSQIKASAYYNFYVYTCNSQSDVGDIDKTTKKGGPASLSVNTTTWDTANCRQVCCTPGHFYVLAKRYVSSLLGAKAKIKTRYGAMCSETADTTISCAFADVSYEFQGGQYWAQSGFIKYW